jgi:hypothetical protein
MTSKRQFKNGIDEDDGPDMNILGIHTQYNNGS